VRIKLTEDGLLKIEKRDSFKKQYCPYESFEAGICCGEYCPMFFVDTKNKQLHLCKKTWNYSELIEEAK